MLPMSAHECNRRPACTAMRRSPTRVVPEGSARTARQNVADECNAGPRFAGGDAATATHEASDWVVLAHPRLNAPVG